MKNALLRGLVIFSLGFGLVALSACAEQNDVETPTTEEPIIDELDDVIEEEPMIDDSTMADSTMMLEEPMEEENAEGDAPAE